MRLSFLDCTEEKLDVILEVLDRWNIRSSVLEQVEPQTCSQFSIFHVARQSTYIVTVNVEYEFFMFLQTEVEKKQKQNKLLEKSWELPCATKSKPEIKGTDTGRCSLDKDSADAICAAINSNFWNRSGSLEEYNLKNVEEGLTPQLLKKLSSKVDVEDLSYADIEALKKSGLFVSDEDKRIAQTKSNDINAGSLLDKLKQIFEIKRKNNKQKEAADRKPVRYKDLGAFEKLLLQSQFPEDLLNSAACKIWKSKGSLCVEIEK